MSNSPLVVYTNLSPNHSGARTHAIDRITPHCVVGQLSAESICGCFTSPTKGASCNYGIGSDGSVSMSVEEKNRSWCSSSNANDQRAVTIECASDKTHPYAMNDAVYDSLIKLCVDICQRNDCKYKVHRTSTNRCLAFDNGTAFLSPHSKKKKKRVLDFSKTLLVFSQYFYLSSRQSSSLAIPRTSSLVGYTFSYLLSPSQP